MYKNANKYMQHSVSNNVIQFSGDPNLTDEEQYEALKIAYNHLTEQNKYETNYLQKKINGGKIQKMMKKLSVYREKVKAIKHVDNHQIGDYIKIIFKERCTPEEWQEVITEAKRRALQP